MNRTETHDYFLNTNRVEALMEHNHLTHGDLAHQLGYSRGYWSMLVNRHRTLTPKVRRCLRKHRLLGKLSEEELWTRTLREVA